MGHHRGYAQKELACQSVVSCEAMPVYPFRQTEVDDVYRVVERYTSQPCRLVPVRIRLGYLSSHNPRRNRHWI